MTLWTKVTFRYVTWRTNVNKLWNFKNYTKCTQKMWHWNWRKNQRQTFCKKKFIRGWQWHRSNQPVRKKSINYYLAKKRLLGDWLRNEAYRIGLLNYSVCLESNKVEGTMPQFFFKKVMVVQARADFEVSYFHFPFRLTVLLGINTV